LARGEDIGSEIVESGAILAGTHGASMGRIVLLLVLERRSKDWHHYNGVCDHTKKENYARVKSQTASAKSIVKRSQDRLVIGSVATIILESVPSEPEKMDTPEMKE
jgi:hypothetical protein